MNPGICDPATDRHSSATDSIKLQIKAGTSKGPVRRQHGDVMGRGGTKMSERRKKKNGTSFMQSPNVTEPNPNQYL